MSNKIMCSLEILNLNDVTRVLASSILRPKKQGLVHFRTINQVKVALQLEQNNKIEIKSPIPQEILAEINPEFKTVKKSVPLEIIEEVAVETKPEWYLSYQQVEEYTKQELLKWSEGVEGLTIPKSKNAAEVTNLVHQFLAEKFEDHAE